MPNKLRAHSSLMLILAFAAATLGYLFWSFMPGMRAVAGIREQIDAKQDYINDAPKLTDAIKQVQLELDATKTYVAAQRKRYPTQAELTVLFGNINRVARDHQMKVTRFEPQATVNLETLAKLPVLFTAEGSFANVHAMIGELEKLPAAIWIDELKVDASREGGKIVQANLMLGVFVDNHEKSN